MLLPDIVTNRGNPNAALPPMVAVTDETGKFAFADVKPGAYLAMAERDGYLRQSYGALPGMVIGSSISVQEHADVTGVNIRMTRQSIIAGRVSQADGEAAQGIPVHAVHWEYRKGVRQLYEDGIAGRTDDRGMFRITSLPPGRYFVYARPLLENASLTSVQRKVQPTFAPNALEISGAIAVDVAPGGDGVATIQLRDDPQFTIRGKVTGSADAPPAGAAVMLIASPDTPVLGHNPNRGLPPTVPVPDLPYTGFARTDADGNFEIEGVLPGLHRLVAVGGRRTRLHFGTGRVMILRQQEQSTSDDGDIAFVEVVVGERDSEGIVMNLLPAGTMTRKVRLENSTSTYSPQLALLPEQGVSGGGKFTARDDDPLYPATQNVSSGRYYLDVPLPTGHYLKSVRLGGEDFTGKRVYFGGGSAELEVVISGSAGKAVGSVTNGEGKGVASATVSVWPMAPDESKQNGGAAISTSAHDGSFAQSSLAPGEYYAAAFEGLPDAGLGQYPEFLAQFAGRAERVKVDLNGSANVSLKVIPKGDVDRAVAALPN
jgi:protocatechuate 3,4-dioxygenase beta subunit